MPSSKGSCIPSSRAHILIAYAEILRAARILKQMEKAHKSNKGAAGLTLEGGGMEMIDAPMIKQVGFLYAPPRATTPQRY